MKRNNIKVKIRSFEEECINNNCITPIVLHHPRKHKAKITYDLKYKLWRIWIE